MPSRAYLDHASSSPLRPAAFEAMLPYLRDHYADPGRLHHEAHIVRVAIEHAREQVAAYVDARPREVVFTSSGTEAINTAHWWAQRHIVSTAVEHSAVRETIERTGAEITIIPVDAQGRFDPHEVIAAVRPDTSLVSIQLANHEVGCVQAVGIVCGGLRDTPTRVHIDACAAFGHIPVAFRTLDADLMSITAHKFGGPPGAGALLVRRGLRLPVFVVGGAQERARRGGLENAPAIVGFGAACAASDIAFEYRANRSLVRQAWNGIANVAGIERYSPPGSEHDVADAVPTAPTCLPNILCFSVAGIEAEPILLALDQRGVAVHSGSACSSETWEPSPVLLAMGVAAQHSLRLSVGWNTTSADIDHFIDAFAAAVTQLRALR